MINLKSIVLENTRINTFKKELTDLIKRWRKAPEGGYDKKHLMDLIKLALIEIEKEKHKSPSQREYEQDKEEFFNHHYTGFIGSDAYKNYEKEGGLSWLGSKSKYPKLLDRGTYGNYEVEFRQTGEKNQYTQHDANGEIVRYPNGDIGYMTPDEIKKANLPEYNTSIVAFVGDKPIGFAGDEFGAVGVWVEGPYQKLGIGTDLLDKHIEQRPTVKSGRGKIGQMTNKGISMTKKYYDLMAKRHGVNWFQKLKQKQQNIKESFEDRTPLQIDTEKFRKSLIQKYPQLEDLYFYISADRSLYLSSIRVKLEDRHMGVGGSVIRDIKKFADDRDLVITLSPEAKRGYTKKLDRFYKDLGFVNNKGRKKDYSLGGFSGRIMYRRPKINESFKLAPNVDSQSEILAKFIASFFLKYFETRVQNSKTKTDHAIVKYNEYYKLAKQYRDEGKKLFKTMRCEEDTNWGQASLRVYPTSGVDGKFIMPDVILKITNGYTTSNGGYVVHSKSPQDIYILVNRHSFIHSFKKSTEELTDTIKHEIRHVQQFSDNIGFPKTKVLSKTADILGFRNIHGYNARERHHMRDVEFKTNLYSYKFHIEKFLNRSFPYKQWKEKFNDIVTGKPIYTGIDTLETIIDNLEHMKNKDFPRWKLFTKELYKLIFPNG